MTSMEMEEFKTLLMQQGQAFDTFKSMIDGELKKKANADDPIVKDKLEKIEKSLDAAVEGKVKLPITVTVCPAEIVLP